ncbi:MAG TPA: DUF1028 domain-containing protein [Polaromonas sp.]|nr:DUF1028 domain-containing protein [Polaromonas sp.]
MFAFSTSWEFEGMELNTFSIVGRCERTGQLGVAVSSAVPAVGSMCIYIQPGIGAVSTQSWVNPYLAMEALASMHEKADASQALAKAIADDPDSRLRQIGSIAISGSGAAFTGADCTTWKGHLVGGDYAIQGNMLTGPETLEAMRQTWLNDSSMDLAERLMQVLEAGDQAGGDFRGKQSAALKVTGREIYAEVDLRVDEHCEPVTELRRVFEVAKHQLLPFVQGMPKRHGQTTALPESVIQMLLKPPASRVAG